MSEIRIITEPTVYFVGRPKADNAEILRFLGDHEAGDWKSDAGDDAAFLPELAGRLCYMSFAKPRPGGNAAYLGHILEAGHGSVLEHSTFNFILTGVSRSFTHELVRHRAGWAYSQLSQRYVDESDVAFVVPPVLLSSFKALEYAEAFRRTHADTDFQGWNAALAGARADLSGVRSPADIYRLSAAAEQFMHACSAALRWYRGLLEEVGKIVGESMPDADKTARLKAAREAARSVLPNCTEAKIFASANARALRHFFEMRGSRHADAEMRRAALAILRTVRATAPNLFGDYRVESADGVEHIVTDYRKV